MPMTFSIRPFDLECEHFMYAHEKNQPAKFTFEPGLTVLVGANGSGKTTLMRRMAKLLEKRGVPVVKLMAQNIEHDLEAQQFWKSDTDALLTMMSASRQSEGQGAKTRFANFVPMIRQCIFAKSEHDQRWIFIDGMDSSQSIDQLIDIAGFFDAIIETAPQNVEVYLIASTNQFELAKGRRCLCVSDNTYYDIPNYRKFKSIVMKSSKTVLEPKTIGDKAWDEVWSDMADTIEKEAEDDQLNGSSPVSEG